MKYQVFISSTYDDLKSERDAVIKSMLEMGHIPVGMEMFSAADEEQWKVITRQIDEVDYYIVILAYRYGSVTDEGISYTEKEYEYAKSKGIPVLAFVIDDAALWPEDKKEAEPSAIQSLVHFKEKVKQKMVNYWNTKDDLQSKVSISLMKAITQYPRPGWVRSDENVGSDVLKELTRLSNENANLRKEIVQFAQKMEKEKDTEVERTVRILIKNKRKAYVKTQKNSYKWGDPIETNLYAIFNAIAPNLINENEFLKIGQDIALSLQGVDYFPANPVPTNFLSDWLSDLVSLNVIEPSKKKHSSADQNKYWMLTCFGLEMHKYMRKVVLEGALIEEEEKEPEDSTP